MRALLLALLALAPQEAPAPASTPTPQELARVLAPVREAHALPALAGAILTRDGVVALGAVGLRSTEGEADVTPDDLWHLGSCTKAMTATLVARMVERGVCAWGTTIGEVFDDLRESMDPAWRDVPLELLLTHRGGAPGELDSKLWMRLRLHSGTPREQRRTLVEAVLREPPAAPPGTRYLYSNAGYAIAGAMLEELTDTPWEELMRREVFAPLGMKGAGFGAPGTVDALDQPLGHMRDAQGALHPQQPTTLADNPAAIGPAGTVHASLSDWARFAAAHLRAGAGDDGDDYLEPATWTKLHAPLEGQDYALGWSVAQRDWAGGTALAHSGSNTMWYCTVWLAPAKGFGVLVATNVGGDEAAKGCDEACGALIRTWLEGAGKPR